MKRNPKEAGKDEIQSKKNTRNTTMMMMMMKMAKMTIIASIY